MAYVKGQETESKFMNHLAKIASLIRCHVPQFVDLYLIRLSHALDTIHVVACRASSSTTGPEYLYLPLIAYQVPPMATQAASTTVL